MLLHAALNHLEGRSIDVALVEGDLEVVSRLGYLNRTSFLFWFGFFFLSLSLEDTGAVGPLSACGCVTSF